MPNEDDTKATRSCGYRASRAPIFPLILITALAASSVTQADPLADAFRDPPRAYGMVPLWSWNGRLDPEQLRRQIDQMVDKGVYGAFMHARAGINQDGTPYFSEGWWEAVETVVEHGRRVGFSAWIYDEDKWPSGAAGGRTLAKNPKRNQAKVLRRHELQVTGPKNVPLSMPEARWVIAARVVGERSVDPESLIDITRFNASSWSCPAGDWIVFGYVFEPHNGINYMNRDTIRDFIDITHEAYKRRFGADFGTTIPGVFFDEIQNEAGKLEGYIVWVEGFEERFREAKGYDLAPLLPALTVDIGRRTPKVRCDYYDVYTTFYEEAWFAQIGRWCADNNLALSGHTIEALNRYVSQGSYMRTQRHLQIPTTDNEDFRYTWPRTIGMWKPKQIASVSHLYGRARVGVEAMGGAGWSFTLDSARYGFNMLAAYGVNFFIPHLFHYAQDKPVNMDDWPNSWFFRNPFWKYFKTFADHGRRLSFMLTGGTHVVDVAVLYPEANLWSGYGSGSVQETLDRLVAAPIDADLIDPDSLMRAKTQAGVLAVGDMRYRVLIVPGARCLRRGEADKILAFARSGGAVIVLERWPTDSMDEGRDDPKLTAFARSMSRLGIQPRAADSVVEAVTEALLPDVILQDARANPLRYQHARRDGKDVYWIANGSRDPDTWSMSFRAVGAPAIWQPEDGSITPVTTFVRTGDRTELTIALDGWQGCFVVFDPSKPVPEGGVRITSTNLVEVAAVPRPDGGVTVSGLLPPGRSRGQAVVEVVAGDARRTLTGQQDVDATDEPILLDGAWRFLAVGDQLDNTWTVDVHETELALPVMRMRWERTTGGPADAWHLPRLDDRRWRRVKIQDALHPDAGAGRYRSRWEGRFISYCHYTPFDLERFFQQKIGGKGLRIRTRLLLPPEATHGWLSVVCPSPFRVYFNDRLCGSGAGGTEPREVALRGLRPGESTLAVEADDAVAILAEGQILRTYGLPIPVFTDATWEVTRNGDGWQTAWEYVAPPERPYGEPPHPREWSSPTVVWYRQPLPPGAAVLREPRIEGAWQAWVDGNPISFADGRAALPAGAELLAIRVQTDAHRHALLEPVRVTCRPDERPLGSWSESNLDGYSGRAIYSRRFDIDDSYLREDVVLRLDLGKVCYNAETWLNGRLVGTRIWPPYEIDITGFVKPGANRLDVVVANLLANRMAWDIFDDAKANLVARRWHDSTIRRDAWCLESGLIGPVRIRPFRKVKVTLPGD